MVGGTAMHGRCVFLQRMDAVAGRDLVHRFDSFLVAASSGRIQWGLSGISMPDRRSGGDGGVRLPLVHLIRHGRPVLTGVMLGQVDSALAPQSIEPSGLDVRSVFTSPLQRASQTAAKLFPDRQAIVVPQLAEITLGEWDGLAWNQIEARWPGLARAKLDDWYGIQGPGGETWGEFEERVRVAWNSVVKAASPCAVVAHAAVNHVLYRFATGDEPVKQQGHCEVISVETIRYPAHRQRTARS